MKKLLLVTMVFCLGIMAYAQNAPQVRDGLKTHSATIENMVGVEPLKAATPSPAAVPTPNFRAPNAISVMDIGTSGNAYGFGYGGGQKTIVYYNGDLNTITNIHRMGGELDPAGYNGDLGYDVSYDGGMTWTNMVEAYVATEPSGQYYADAARYPQAVIYNPEGNTDPANAWMAFFAPNLDATNGTWGGYSYGVHKMTAASNVDTTKNLLGSSGEYFQYIPDGMDISRTTGTVLVSDLNQDWTSGSLDYLGQIMLSRGTYSEAEGDIVYEKIMIDAPIVNVEDQSRPTINRVAFAPDGETAWIVIFADNGENEIIWEDYMTLYPILYKSEDGGETWSDPINVQLDGPDGIPGILNFITDEQWDTLWEDPETPRDEVAYTVGFDCDLTVDANGNPHIATAVGVAGSNPYSIITAYPYLGLMDIYSPDGGETWEAVEIGRPHNFRGTFGDLTEDNRVCAATNWDGTKVFFTYLDTDPEVNPDDNSSPDIWARGFDPMANMMTADAVGADMPTNVTFGSAAMWQSYFGTLAEFVIQDGDSYTLPIVYEEMTPDDPGAAVQFKYIKDFAFVDADFTIQVGPAPLIANFSADETTVDEGATVNFTDMSAGATSWSWEFEGGEPATSNEQNPSVVYATEGVYDVTLTVSNGTEEDMMMKDDYITVNGGGVMTYAVTFNVDMNEAIAAGEFVVGTDVVYVTGSMTGWTEPGQDGSIMMSDDDGDGIYTTAMDLEAGDYQFKYFKNAGWDGGEWTGDPNRLFTIVDKAETLDCVWAVEGYVGVEELESMITISPNPATNYFKVAADRNYTVEVMDLSGRIVTTAQMMSNEVIINMDDQEAGIYIVRMSNETVSFFKKIVKQ